MGRGAARSTVEPDPGQLRSPSRSAISRSNQGRKHCSSNALAALPSRLPSTAVTAGGGQALWSPQDDCLLVRMEAGRGEEDSHGRRVGYPDDIPLLRP